MEKLPDKLRKQATKVVQKSQQEGRNAVKLNFTPGAKIDICGSSFEPINHGADLVRCAYCGTAYKTEFKLKLEPNTSIKKTFPNSLTELMAHSIKSTTTTILRFNKYLCFDSYRKYRFLNMICESITSKRIKNYRQPPRRN